ncbi:MAG: WXG100 family type VII secretion target [Oscillospiraceae bacterium]|nr:WXG100 family type VII secretion target [Oscillospiraceae bacterium]
MANMILRVTPEVLESTADQFSEVVKDIKNRFNRIQAISSKTKGYWQGDAGTRDRESYASYKEDISFLMKRLEEHPTDLLSMAGIYRAAEQEAVSQNAALKTNEIV